MSPAALPGRRLALLSRDTIFNGVDFAEAQPGRIGIHFINRVRVKGALARDRPPVTLSVSGALAPAIHPVDEEADWSTDTSGRPVLHVRADLPDAPARYLLTVHSDRIDPCLRFAAITVRRAALDGEEGEVQPAAFPLGGQRVPVDYLAKDFASFLAALSSFSAARYPRWTERSEADFGVMLMEVLSALADELSYLQDRVAAEATIGTATQRLSLVRHARLVDHEPMPALAATTVVQLDVAPRAPGDAPLPAVIQVQAVGGQAGAVDFAAVASFAGPVLAGPVLAGPVLDGPVLAGPALDGRASALDARWNRYDQTGRVAQLVPYQWDPTVTWLRRGTTSMWVRGHGHGFYPGQQLLIDTAAAPGDSPAREIVQLTGAEERTDPVQGQHVTLIRWADRLVGDHDLTRMELAGNLLPAVHGQVTDEVFAIPGTGQPPAVPAAIARGDSSGSPVHYLYTLTRPLAWRAAPVEDGGPARPEPALTLREVTATGSAPGAWSRHRAGATWHWVRRLIDASETARAFTVTPERYSPAASADGLTFADYDGDGTTVRFGDGTFGRPPVPGTTFRARYLAGGGEIGNVAANTIVTVAPGDPANGLVWRCSNPFAATGGTDAETHAQIRDRAPQVVRSGVLSLTGPADYEAAALAFSPPGTLVSRPGSALRPTGADGRAWARQATAAERWTGSWLTTATIADPLADESAATQLAALAALAETLGARRLAGTDISVGLARYRWLDLRITCATRAARRPADVSAAVIRRLAPGASGDGATGFFDRGNWAFGQPLEAPALMAAIQSCPGVAGVTRAEYRWAHGPGEWQPLPLTLGVAAGEVLRVDNDPGQPGHGLLFVTAQAPR